MNPTMPDDLKGSSKKKAVRANKKFVPISISPSPAVHPPPSTFLRRGIPREENFSSAMMQKKEQDDNYFKDKGKRFESIAVSHQKISAIEFAEPKTQSVMLERAELLDQ